MMSNIGQRLTGADELLHEIQKNLIHMQDTISGPTEQDRAFNLGVELTRNITQIQQYLEHRNFFYLDKDDTTIQAMAVQLCKELKSKLHPVTFDKLLATGERCPFEEEDLEDCSYKAFEYCHAHFPTKNTEKARCNHAIICLLYTSDAADE